MVALEGGTEVDLIKKSDFIDRCAKEPEFAYRIMQYMGDRIRDLTESYMKAAHTVDNMEVTVEKGEPRSKELQEEINFFRQASRLFRL